MIWITLGIVALLVIGFGIWLHVRLIGRSQF